MSVVETDEHFQAFAVVAQRRLVTAGSTTAS
jgi:hypothetical protein